MQTRTIEQGLLFKLVANKISDNSCDIIKISDSSDQLESYYNEFKSNLIDQYSESSFRILSEWVNLKDFIELFLQNDKMNNLLIKIPD